MLITAYQFKLTESNQNLPTIHSCPDLPKNMLRAQDIREWLCLGYLGGCEFFCISEKRISPEKIWQVLKEKQTVRGGSQSDQNMVTGRKAVHRFLQIATGTGSDKEGKKLLELLHETYTKATEQEQIGPYLHRLFQRGVWLYEKVRQETQYFHYPVEVETVFRELAGKILGALEHANVYFIGNDPTLKRVLDALQQAGCRKIFMLGNNSTWDKSITQKIAGSIPFSANTPSLPSDADILLIYSSANKNITEKAVAKRMNQRSQSPLVVLDWMNGSFDYTRLKKIDNLYIYTSKDIEHVIEFNRGEQQKAAKKIEHWIGDEIEAFYEWHAREDRFQFAGIIGATPQMQRIFELISRIARTDITVLIDGESGTGKELVARAIHRLSARANKPFVPVNCGAIPENLLESELFGHVRGAFTGAVSPKQGLFESANSGILFLDEIGELPQHLQIKILRFLQDGEIKRVGSNQTVRVDVRILAATNKDLGKMVKQGSFRSDLYYRLNVLQLTLPPLRDRREDLPVLVQHFLKKFSTKFHKEVNEVSPEAMQAIQDYEWPGNVRELENAIERGVALAIGNALTLYDLPAVLQEPPPDQKSETGAKQMTLKEMEKNYILETMEACDWNHEMASKQLAIGRTTLWRKLREYKIGNDSERKG